MENKKKGGGGLLAGVEMGVILLGLHGLWGRVWLFDYIISLLVTRTTGMAHIKVLDLNRIYFIYSVNI